MTNQQKAVHLSEETAKHHPLLLPTRSADRPISTTIRGFPPNQGNYGWEGRTGFI
jgi:hypothetical protein